MHIIIKVLKGQDCPLEVNEATTILDIKKQIEKILKIPIGNQKLLLVGRTLSDECSVSFYPSIKDGSKLNLIVMRPEGLREIISRSFRKFFTEQQSELLTKKFMEDFEKKMTTYSLDDIERLANNL
ncbi:ubiquitin-like protein 4A [Teleopsis dalmanni]|uniref:ubiquitin-like protein 4A n=1 Tax=Teleopsis dalmanni TaxID=139649 RepID=UPI0018CF1C0D|nr:ubiquitin-like protein 4A [Teleopsis dalmanni]XP_037952247.1 ubiquitin-like protein 4A [Teleopsis dalmanni]